MNIKSTPKKLDCYDEKGNLKPGYEYRYIIYPVVTRRISVKRIVWKLDPKNPLDSHPNKIMGVSKLHNLIREQCRI